jgi:isopenicillin N synthase-like dioxygenase
MSIKIIDITPFLSYESNIEEKLKVAQEVNDARKNEGFFYIRSSLISKPIIDEYISQTTQFFRISTTEQKLTLHQGSISGYSVETFREEQGVTDAKEFLTFRGDPSDYSTQHTFMQKETAWPYWMPDNLQFRKAVKDYMMLMYDISFAVLHAFSLAVHSDEYLFDKMFLEPIFGLRAIRYPPLTTYNKIPGKVYVNCGEHKDEAILTLLRLLPGDHGLQIKHDKGHWLTINAIPDTFVVNTGMAMEILTGGIFKAVPHRVVVPEEDCYERFSFPFFLHPSATAEMYPIVLEGGSNQLGHPMFGKKYGEYIGGIVFK